jgi:hypothetical protein
MLTSSTMAHIVRQHAGDPVRVVEALVAAANDAGGKDNVTAVYAEGPLFAAALGSGGASALTPTEPLGERTIPRPPVRSGGPPPGTTRSIVRSPVLWFVIGTLLGILGALGLTLYIARTQVLPPQTLVVSGADGSPFATIGSAMAAARPGDVVRVEPGAYVEQVVVADGVDLVAREPGSVTISRPAALDPSVAGVQAGGTQPVRISGIHVSATASPAGAGIAIAGAGVTLELMEISGSLGRAIAVLPDASVTVRGSRVAVTGAVLSVPDGSQATLVNNILTRATASPEPAIAAGPLSRLTLAGNLFAGFPSDIVRGVGDARRKELLTGNVIVAPPAPARSGRPPR